MKIDSSTISQISPKTIQLALRSALKLSNGNKALLSRLLGIRSATVCAWYKGSNPNWKNFLKVTGLLKNRKGASNGND